MSSQFSMGTFGVRICLVMGKSYVLPLLFCRNVIVLFFKVYYDVDVWNECQVENLMN